MIATPFTVQYFTVIFDSTVDGRTSAKHPTADCGTTYPSQEYNDQTTNPITGLVVYPPDISKPTDSPYFSLARLSATPTNLDWYQTNLPLLSSPGEAPSRPAWVKEISELLDITQPFSLAYRYHNPDGHTKSESGDEGSDNEEEDEEDDDFLDDDDDEFEDDEFEEDPDKDTLLPDSDDPIESMEKIHTNRLRIWGMASSPGGGVTAVFATLYSTIKPERHTFAGLRCRIYFGKSLSPVDSTLFSTRKLSTEARAFEWMYGDAPPVPGVGNSDDESAEVNSKRQAIKDAFKPAAENAICVLCRAGLDVQNTISKCPNGHVFGTYRRLKVLVLNEQCTDVCSSKLCSNRSPYFGAGHLEQLRCLWLQVSET